MRQLQSPIKVTSSEFYSLILEDANGTTHFWLRDGAYDSWDIAMPDEKKPFNKCEECGSPLLEGEPLAVVLYFDSEVEKADFVKMINESGALRAYSVN